MSEHTEGSDHAAGRHASGVPVCLVEAHLVAARAHGMEVETALCRAGLDPGSLADAGARIPLETFARLIRQTGDALGNESAGFTERRLKPGTWAMMCHATITCPNLRRAILRAARFYALLQDEIHFDLVERGEEAFLYVRHLNKLGLDDHAFIESLMVIWLRWSSWLIDREVLPERILFAFAPPPYVAEYGDMFPCDHYFNEAVNCVVFPARYLDRPVVRDVAELADFLNRAPESLMRRYIAEVTLSTQVRRMIRRSADFTALGLEETASALNMSAQTLRRRLREEGNGFQDLKDAVRKDIAIEQLLSGDRPINEIAEAVGFSEPSAFHRAFKKWTGLTPGAYRENRGR